MTDRFKKAALETAALQKLWLETFSKAVQTAFKCTPDSAPPEMVRQIRAGIFQTLAESWDEFLRSPQFLDGMRQWMDNAITFRKISNEFMGRVRNDLQAPSCTDVDTVMLAVRHMETRLLDRLDQMSLQVAELERKSGHAPPARRINRTRSKVGNHVRGAAEPTKGRRP